MDKIGKKKFIQIFWGINILLLSVLFLVALSVSLQEIIDDYETMKSANLSVIKFIKLDFPPVINPIGPFGAFFGYWFSIILGKFFSISLLIGSMFLGFFMVFLKNDMHPYKRVFSFIIFAFFVNIGSIVLISEKMNAAGIVPGGFYDFLINIF